MENQLTTDQNSSRGLTVIEAIQHPLKIINAKDQDLMNALGYCFACIGLVEPNLPKGLMKSFLLEFIRNNFKFYTVEEIKTAFTMLVKGELGDKTPKHYNNFSPEYFGSVMVCYKIHREKAATEIFNRQNKRVEVPHVVDNVQKAKAQKEFDEMVVNPIFEKYKQYKRIETGTTPAKFVYNSLVNHHKIIEFSNDEKKAIKVEAEQVVKSRAEELKSTKAFNYKDHKDNLKMIGEIFEPEKLNDQVINECHIICIRRCFDKMIELNCKL